MAVQIYLYFVSLAVIVLVHRGIGGVLHKIGAQRIIGDIIAGCLLGPSVWGVGGAQVLFPLDNRPIINMFGQFGLILTSMVAGFSFDRRVLKGHVAHVCVFTLMNMLVPILFTVPLFYFLPTDPTWRGPNYTLSAYFTLLASGMASSALPMVFLILDELKIVNDTARFCIGWSCLTLIGLFTMVSIASVFANPNLTHFDIVLRLTFLALVAAGLLVIQLAWNRALKKVAANAQSFLRLASDDLTILVITLGLLAAVASERLGYTFLLGAFLAGAAMPFDNTLRQSLSDKIRWLTRWVFLPQFFVNVGLNFNVRDVSPTDFGYVCVTLLFAILSKASLIPLSKLLLGFGWRESCFCAALANCRGFNALIIASVGQQLGQIGDSFFITDVLLSLISTAMAGPLAAAFKPPESPVLQPASPRHRRAKSLQMSSAAAGSPREHLKEGILEGAVDSAVDSAADDEHEDLQPVQQEPPVVWFDSSLVSDDANKSSVLIVFESDIVTQLSNRRLTVRAVEQTDQEIIFRGKDLVEWLITHAGAKTRPTARLLGQRLLEAGVILPQQKAYFADDGTLYAFSISYSQQSHSGHLDAGSDTHSQALDLQLPASPSASAAPEPVATTVDSDVVDVKL